MYSSARYINIRPCFYNVIGRSRRFWGLCSMRHFIKAFFTKMINVVIYLKNQKPTQLDSSSYTPKCRADAQYPRSFILFSAYAIFIVVQMFPFHVTKAAPAFHMKRHTDQNRRFLLRIETAASNHQNIQIWNSLEFLLSLLFYFFVLF